MPWNIFRPRASRDGSQTAPQSTKRSSNRHAPPPSREASPLHRRSKSQSAATVPNSRSTAIMTDRPRVDSESNPLSGITAAAASRPAQTAPPSPTAMPPLMQSSAKRGPVLPPKHARHRSTPLVSLGNSIAPSAPRPTLSTASTKLHTSSAHASTKSTPSSPASAGPTGSAGPAQFTEPTRPESRPEFRSTERPRSIHKSSLKRAGSTHSLRSMSSYKTVRTTGSRQASRRARHIKAAHDAKHASHRYLAANRGKHLICFTCGTEFSDAHCAACLTTYVPPDFKYNASSAALFGAEPTRPKPAQSSGASGSGVSFSGASEATGSGASVFLGFYPDDEETEPGNKLDLELVTDLALCNESGLLEAVLFECFCNVDTVVEAFRHEGDPLIDTAKVGSFYDSLSTMTSTVPIRGVLQGAQAVLQNRRHEPLTENELVYVGVILLCPAITDCSMFTKITGPMQKLSKYAGLRSRARVLLEVCSGLISHASPDFRCRIVQLFANLDAYHLGELVDLCNGYVSHRLSFDYHYKSGQGVQPSTFQLVRHEWYADDWRIVVVVRLMALLWSANRLVNGLPLSRFYNTMVDLVDLKADFDAWQTATSAAAPSSALRKLSFCRYPFLLSAGSKARVLGHANQREINRDVQREVFSYLANPQNRHSSYEQEMHVSRLRTVCVSVRRNHLFADSMQQLLQWPPERRRSLLVEFRGEPGVDAGGLKKEWFLMFYRGFFDPSIDLFQMDDTSNYYWFSRTANLDYCRVAGQTLGLALQNSVTIDFNLPRLLFKILLNAPYDLNDIGTLWPDIAQSFQSILDYTDEDFEDAFGLTFTAPDGTQLLPDGEQLSVTLAARETYVSLMIDYFVNAEGAPVQTFKKAFLSICGGNAISMFEPEELEHLIHGDRQPFDIPALRSVTRYVNFGHRYDRANREPVVQWFWDYFSRLEPASQARLLQFVTATDRPPAAGFLQMRFSIMCLGGDSERLPIAHTCFNQLCLYRYKNRQKLERKLSLAIKEFQGFGLK